MKNPLSFFDKHRAPERPTPEEQKRRYLSALECNLADGASALHYLGRLQEYNRGLRAQQEVQDMINAWVGTRELVEAMTPAAFVKWEIEHG